MCEKRSLYPHYWQTLHYRIKKIFTNDQILRHSVNIAIFGTDAIRVPKMLFKYQKCSFLWNGVEHPVWVVESTVLQAQHVLGNLNIKPQLMTLAC